MLEQAPRLVRGRAGWRELVVVFIIALGLSLAWFHNTFFAPINTQAGVFGDANEYAWFLGWVPYALGHGLNPLGTTIVNFPHGVNMMWNTSILLPSFLMSPVTVIFGAAFSYNVLAVLAPALNSTFAYLAFRRWTGRLPSLAGALIFGFSPFIVSQSVGHLAQTLLMSVPLILIVLDRLLVVQASKWWLDGLLLGVLAWAQLLTGEEILALEAVVAADHPGRDLRDERPGHLPSRALRGEGPGRERGLVRRAGVTLPCLSVPRAGPRSRTSTPPTCM